MTWTKTACIIAFVCLMETISIWQNHLIADRLFYHQNEILTNIGSMHGETVANNRRVAERMEALNGRLQEVIDQQAMNMQSISELEVKFRHRNQK